MRKKILVIDDEEAMRNLLETELKLGDYMVMTAEDADDALDVLKTDTPDLILLDLMLPGISGFEFCRILKENPVTKDIPVIMLTNVGKVSAKVSGFERGIEDYITKPFNKDELLARINVVLRRFDKSGIEETVFKSGDMTFYPERHVAEIGDKTVKLTPKELRLLQYLMSNREKVVNRDKLLNDIWGLDYIGGTRTLDVHIKNLREKLGKHAGKIVTVGRVGYKFSSRRQKQ